MHGQNMVIFKSSSCIVLLAIFSSCYSGLHHAGQGHSSAHLLLHVRLRGTGAEGRALPRIVLLLRGGGEPASIAGRDHRRGNGVEEGDSKDERVCHRGGAGERRQRGDMEEGEEGKDGKEGEEGSYAPLSRRPRLASEGHDDAGGGAYTPPNLRVDEVEENESEGGDSLLLQEDEDGHDHHEIPAMPPPPPPTTLPSNHTGGHDRGIKEAAAGKGDAKGRKEDADEEEDSDEILWAEDSDDDVVLDGNASFKRKVKTHSEEEREFNARRGIFPWLDVRPLVAPPPKYTRSIHDADSTWGKTTECAWRLGHCFQPLSIAVLSARPCPQCTKYNSETIACPACSIVGW